MIAFAAPGLPFLFWSSCLFVALPAPPTSAPLPTLALPAPAAPVQWKPADSPESLTQAFLSPDGKRMAWMAWSGEEKRTLLFDRSGKLLRRLPESGELWGRPVGFTPDGSRFLVQRSDSGNPRADSVTYEALVWEVETGRLLKRLVLLPGQGQSVRHWAVSDTTVVAAGVEEFASVYDLRTGKFLGNLPFPCLRQRAHRLATSADGRWLVTAHLDTKVESKGRENHVVAWDLKTRKQFHLLYDFSCPVNDLALSADGRWCAVLTAERGVWVFDRATAEVKARADTLFFRGQGQFIRFSPDGRTVVATGQGGRRGLFVWDWQDSQQMRGGYPPGRFALRSPEMQDKKTWGSPTFPHLASDNTLLTLEEDQAFLWDLSPPKPPAPPPSADPPPTKRPGK